MDDDKIPESYEEYLLMKFDEKRDSLSEYLERNDSNAWWKLSSGEQQVLFDEAVERIEQLKTENARQRERLKELYVLITHKILQHGTEMVIGRHNLADDVSSYEIVITEDNIGNKIIRLRQSGKSCFEGAVE